MSQCDCSYSDYDSPSIYRAETIKARKIHKCCECHSVIEPGQRYERVTGLWEGQFDTIHTCLSCVAIRKQYCPHGFLHEGLRETLIECLDLDYLDPDYGHGDCEDKEEL